LEVEQAAAPVDAPGRAQHQPWRRRFALPMGIAAAGVLLFVCYLRMSLTNPPTSDGAANALQAWDILHGNVLLHSWALSDVSFYTTELPEYVLVELARGLHMDVVNIAGALTYTILVLVAALVAKGNAIGRQGLLRMALTAGIMLSPQLRNGASILMLQPDHVGSSVPVLIAWLIMDRAGRRPWVPIAVGLALVWGLIADPIVLYIGIIPLVVVSSMRAYLPVVKEHVALRAVWYELLLIAAALVALVVGLKVPEFLHQVGGFKVASAPNLVGSPGQMTRRGWLTVQGLLLLFGANFLGHSYSLATSLVLLHLVGLVLAAWAFCRGVRRFAVTDDVVAQLLVAAIVVILVAYAGGSASNLSTTRDIAAALPFGAVLAGRLLPERLTSARLLPALAVVLVGYIVTLAINIVPATAPAADSQLVTWLTQHGYRYGLANYWQANAVTLASANRVQIRAIRTVGPGVAPYRWESKRSWYNPTENRANFAAFVMVQPGNERYLPTSQVIWTFGRPAHQYHFGKYTVLVWNYNLLTRIRWLYGGHRYLQN
jgi:hypothetical protein